MELAKIQLSRLNGNHCGLFKSGINFEGDANDFRRSERHIVPSIQLRALIQDSVIPVEAERPLMV
jgi:hypothetical protein